VRIDSFTVQWTLMAAAGAAALLSLIAAASLIPTKLLVFDEGIAVKSLSYRSTWIPLSAIDELSTKRLLDVVGERGFGSLRSTWLLTPALWRPALYMRLASGRAWFIKTRDTAELLSMLRNVKARKEVVPSVETDSSYSSPGHADEIMRDPP
jgi:hypothetical protein